MYLRYIIGLLMSLSVPLLSYAANLEIVSKEDVPEDTIFVGPQDSKLCQSPDGRKVYMRGGIDNPNVVYSMDADTFEVIKEIKMQALGVPAISPDGNSLYLIERGRSCAVCGYTFRGPRYFVSVLDAETLKVKKTIKMPHAVNGIAVSPDGERVYVATVNTGSVSVIDAKKNEVIKTIKVDGVYPKTLAVSPDNTRIYVTDIAAGIVSVIHAGDLKVLATIRLGKRLNVTVISPNGKRIYVSAEGAVSVIDAETLKVIETKEVEDWRIAVSPDSMMIYMLEGRSLLAMDADTLVVRKKTFVGNGASMPVFSPSSKRLYVSNSLVRTVSVIDAEAFTVLKKIELGGGGGWAPEISLDGMWIRVRTYGLPLRRKYVYIIDLDRQAELLHLNDSGLQDKKLELLSDLTIL